MSMMATWKSGVYHVLIEVRIKSSVSQGLSLSKTFLCVDFSCGLAARRRGPKKKKVDIFARRGASIGFFLYFDELLELYDRPSP
jgi:hypothetical protein